MIIIKKAQNQDLIDMFVDSEEDIVIKVKMHELWSEGKKVYGFFDYLGPGEVQHNKKIIHLSKLAKFSKNKNGLFLGDITKQAKSMALKENSKKEWTNGHICYLFLYNLLADSPQKKQVCKLLNVDKDYKGKGICIKI